MTTSTPEPSLASQTVTIDALKAGMRARVKAYTRCSKAYRHKLLSMGLTRGAEITVLRRAPLGCPIEIEVRGSALCLRKNEAIGIDWEICE